MDQLEPSYSAAACADGTRLSTLGLFPDMASGSRAYDEQSARFPHRWGFQQRPSHGDPSATVPRPRPCLLLVQMTYGNAIPRIGVLPPRIAPKSRAGACVVPGAVCSRGLRLPSKG